MSQPPSRPYQGRRYRVEDPYEEYPGSGEPARAGYRPPGPRRPDGRDGYRPSYGGDDHNRYGAPYDQEPAYGAPSRHEPAYEDRYDDRRRHDDQYRSEPTYGGYRSDPGYDSYDDTRYQTYGQPPAQQYRGYSDPATYPTAVYQRVSPRPAPNDRRAAPPSRRSRKVLVALAVVLLFAVGGGTAFALLRTDLGLEDTGPAQLTTPDTLAGRPKIKDGELQKLADELVATIERDLPEATSTIGAFYGSPAKKNMIMVAGASGKVSNPAGQLDRAMKEMAAGGLAVRNVSSAEAGPLGGVAKCGDATADGVPMGVCAWSDRGSLVLVVVYFANGSKAKAELVGIRAAIEQRG